MKIGRELNEFLAASGICLTVADAGEEDFPLVAANAAFLRMTGYAADDVVGRNCRFLQPEGGAGPVRERIRGFLNDAAQDEGRFLLPNRRKDGAPFLNLLYLSKIRRDARIALILGSQFDFSRHDRSGHDSYDRTLREDMRELSRLTGEMGMVTLGTFQSLATSAAIIAQARMDER